MRKFNAVVGRMETFVGVCMMATIVVMVFLAAFLRLRVVNRPIVWSVDLAQLLLIWVCMFGADVALKRHAHVGLDILVRIIPDKLGKAIQLGTHILCLGFLAFMIYWGVRLCVSNYLRQYATLGVSYSFGTAAIPVGSLFMIFTILEQMGELLKQWNKPTTLAVEAIPD